MSAPRNARQRARAEMTREITDVARRQLASGGAAALSLRAVARELDMASSAVYRYFRSREELLTALLLDAFHAIGDAAETADAEAKQACLSATRRWVTVAHAVREWSLQHRHEFALLYGTPDPDYAAPQTTGTAAARMPLTFAGILAAAQAAGELNPVAGPAVDETLLHPDARALLPQDLPVETAVRFAAAWSQMVGLISFELFGHFHNVTLDGSQFFDHAVRTVAAELGMR